MPKVKDGVFITKQEDIDYLLSLEEKDLTISLIIELLGKFNNKRRFEPFNYIKIPPNSYGPEGKRNKNEFTTTVGLWIFNRLCIEKELFELEKYINYSVDDDVFNDIVSDITYARLEDKVPLDALKHFLLKSQILMRLTTVLAAHYDDAILSLSDKLKPLKTKLIKENKKALEDGDEVVAEDISNQLIAQTKEILKDDDAMEIFDCKARGNIENNLKNMCMMKGAVYNNVTGKYDIATSCYMDGISKEDYHIFANSIAPGATARAIKTQIGGYWEKLLFSGFQHISISPKGSDCKTKRTIRVKLTKKNIKQYMYCFVQQGDKVIEITSDTKNQFIDKTVNLRFAALCEGEDICEVCGSSLFRRIGIAHIGMAMSKIASTTKQRSLKAFHNSVVKTTDITDMLNDAFGILNIN